MPKIKGPIIPFGCNHCGKDILPSDNQNSNAENYVTFCKNSICHVGHLCLDCEKDWLIQCSCYKGGVRCKNKYCLDCGTKNEKNNNSIMKIYPTEDFNGFYYICYKCCRSLEIIENEDKKKLDSSKRKLDNLYNDKKKKKLKDEYNRESELIESISNRVIEKLKKKSFFL